MKWATPASAGVSSREPASTYAAIDTDRDPGSRAEMTRGPAGSSVRWNIGSMVARNVGPAGGREGAGAAGGWVAGTRSGRRGGLPERQDPVLQEEHEEQDRHQP